MAEKICKDVPFLDRDHLMVNKWFSSLPKVEQCHKMGAHDYGESCRIWNKKTKEEKLAILNASGAKNDPNALISRNSQYYDDFAKLDAHDEYTYNRKRNILIYDTQINI